MVGRGDHDEVTGANVGDEAGSIVVGAGQGVGKDPLAPHFGSRVSLGIEALMIGAGPGVADHRHDQERCRVKEHQAGTHSGVAIAGRQARL